MNYVIGIDPDASKPGFALVHGKKIIEMRSMPQPELIEYIVGLAAAHEIIVKIEDVEASKPTYVRPGAGSAEMLKIAQNVGQVKQSCRDVVAQLKSKGITPVMVKPLRGPVKKQAKENHAYFCKLTGWNGGPKSTNQDKRDAAMIALWGNAEVKSWRS
ncbi:hypothetical protein [Shewanella fodinae]|uniref:hypothetical protein n=1 Tax=Shewanella fodinae TaxID=552357 RepID=UPI001677C43E|nr:hypothetical protein [Shewanella fodinae]MCL2905209.1 hypothetical protein [Shewanella fodinae]GGY87764.1 hypothetical protein GCM10007169_01160 [Shewanella fodinae]